MNAPESQRARASSGAAAVALALAAAPLVLLVAARERGPGPAAVEPAPAARAVGEALAASAGAGERQAASVRSGRAPETTTEDDPRRALPGTEAAFRAGFRAAWQAGGAARARLERDAVEQLRSAGSDAERVALLLTLREAGSPVGDELLAVALRELPDVSGPHGESLPALAVGLLARQPALRPAERRSLEEALHRRASLKESTRGRALRTLVEKADDAELSTLTSLVAGEVDPLVRAIGEQALRSRTRNDPPTPPVTDGP